MQTTMTEMRTQFSSILTELCSDKKSKAITDSYLELAQPIIECVCVACSSRVFHNLVKVIVQHVVVYFKLHIRLLHNASGPYIGLPGRSVAKLLPRSHGSQPSGRPSADRRADFHCFPVRAWPKASPEGPEGRFKSRRHH